VAGLETGRATDLQTLIHAAPPTLWTLRWRSVHAPLDLVTGQMTQLTYEGDNIEPYWAPD